MLVKLNINFVENNKKNGYQPLFIFGLGVVSIALATGWYLYIRNEMQYLDASENQPLVQQKHIKKITEGKEHEQIQLALEQINIPWDQLFDAVESIQPKDTILVSMTPEPQKRSFTISGESKDAKAMLEYVRALSSRTGLFNVHLISQQTVVNGKEESLGFDVEGNWAK